MTVVIFSIHAFQIDQQWDSTTIKLMTLQQIIGGKLTLEGCIDLKWQDILQLYISSLGSKHHDGERFLMALIKLLW